jgi:HEAT repeat protein
MKTNSALAFSLTVLCLLAETARAHGGQYRGPTMSPGRLIGPGSPGPTPGGPITGGPGSVVPDATRWQVWWELNKDPYLRAPKLALDPAAPENARKIITEKQKVEIIVPALKKALDETSNQHMTSACMIALGKIGLDTKEFKILDEFRKRLKRGNQEIREVAALAMGISKNPDAIDDLSALLEDKPLGRKWVGRAKVDDRTRSFAAYGLGLIARGNEDANIKFRVFETLKRALGDKDLRDRDILIAILNAFRLLDPQPAKGGKHRRLLWSAIETLEKYHAVDVSKSRQAVKAHVPPAVAELLGRGTGADRERIKKSYSALFKSRRRRHATLYQSTAIAMGRLLVPVEEDANEGPHMETMRRHFDKSHDELTGNFGLIAMGQIGGKDNLEHLLKTFRTGKRDTQGWAAIALGLFAFHAPVPDPKNAPRSQTPTDTVRIRIGKALHRALLRINNRDVRAAAALGLGLGGYTKAAPDMRRLLKKYRKIEEFAGYLAMGLALMDDKPAGKLIEEIMSEASRKPLLMTQTALALARLEHPGASITLRSILRTGGRFRTITLASTSNAMGYLADPGNVAPLVRILANKSNNKMVRAFAAVALGSMAENDALTWSAWIAMNMNYSATVSTLSNGSSGILDIL